MLKIDTYSFGKVLINNQLYIKDFIITGNIIHENWRRKSGHSIVLNDIRLVIDYQPDILFIGTGKFGIMKVSEDFLNEVKKSGIDEIKINKSGNIVDQFNQCEKVKKALAIHLTC